MRQPRKKAKANPPANVNVEITECAAKYALAIADPWDPDACGACIPQAPARPSYKTRAILRGTFQVGASMGFIAVAPVLSNDRLVCYSTDSTFAGNTVACSASAPAHGVNGSNMVSLPFTTSQLTSSIAAESAAQGRIVSCGVSARYVDTELNRGGRVICFSDPDHGSVVGESIAALGGRPEADFSSPDAKRPKCWVASYAQNGVEMAYPMEDPTFNNDQYQIQQVYPLSQNQPVSLGVGDQGYGAPIMCIVATGVVGNTYEYEIVLHVEYVGAATSSMITPNSADNDGVALVQTALGRTPAARVSTGLSFQKAFKQQLIRAAKEISKVALRKGGLMLLAAL